MVVAFAICLPVASWGTYLLHFRQLVLTRPIDCEAVPASRGKRFSTASVDIGFIRSLWFSSSHRPNSRPSTPWGFLPSGDSVDSVTRGNNFYFAAYFSGPFYLKCREKSSDLISRDSGLVLRLLLLGDNYRRVPIAEPPPKRITVFGKLGKSIWYQGGM